MDEVVWGRKSTIAVVVDEGGEGSSTKELVLVYPLLDNCRIGVISVTIHMPGCPPRLFRSPSHSSMSPFQHPMMVTILFRRIPLLAMRQRDDLIVVGKGFCP